MPASTQSTQGQTEQGSAPSGDDNTKASAPSASQPAAAQPIPPNWWDAITAGDDEALKTSMTAEITKVLSNKALSNYSTVFLFDAVDNISSYHSDRLYAAASSVKDSGRDILLILHSTGGQIEPAYLIGMTLKRLSASKFVVVVP